MNDELDAALRAEGLTDEAVQRVRRYLAERNLYVAENWLVRERREKAEAKVARERAHAAAFELAIPYQGAIKRCQAEVWSSGRGATANRCSKGARFVVRRKERPGNDPADPRGDGRIAVCRVHASDSASHRYHKHWRHERTANEPVEPEYQPE